MKDKFGHIRSRILLLIASLSLVIAGQTLTHAAEVDLKKAILVSKLAKNVTWPNESTQSTFIIGVYKDVEKFNYFNQFFANKGVRNKDISVRLVDSYSQAKLVNILYLSSPNKNKSLRMVSRILNGSQVLVVTEDIKDLTKTMIDISYEEQDSRINVRVVDANMKAENLTMPEWSFLANNQDNENVLSASPTFAAKTEEEQRALNKIAIETQKQQEFISMKDTIAKQKSSLAKLNTALSASKKNSKDYSAALKKETDNLKIIQQVNVEKEESLKAQNEIIQRLELALKEKEASSTDESTAIGETNEEVAGDAQNEENAAAIVKLTNELSSQKEEAARSAEKLATLSTENSRLSNFQLFFYLFMVIAIAALAVAFLMWKKAKTQNTTTVLPVEPVEDLKPLLAIRTEQLVKSENVAALGYVATDITYAVGLSLDDLHEQFDSIGDATNAASLKPIMNLLENFNLIAADQDDTEVRSFDLITYIQDMLSLYDFEFSQSNIVYNYSGEKSLKIKSVPSYIALVLINVINNSLKHGFDNNGNGKLAMKVESSADFAAKISFSDNGIGMKSSVLEQVLVPFFTTQSERGYVGVGMSNTQNLVKKLGGEIAIESKEGKGTTVIITLPNA